ncbi:MAG: hypothetical protein AABZ39_12250 [Spirochaetota bacterium]
MRNTLNPLGGAYNSKTMNFISNTGGDLLVVLDSTLAPSVISAFNGWKTDVERAGWVVTVASWTKANKDVSNHVKLAEQIIWPYIRSKGVAPHVFLIGKLPMPYTGLDIPTSHEDRGAYASTLFYAAPDGQWTDIGDNSFRTHRTAALKNVPGDGKFDQMIGPGSSSPDSRHVRGALKACVGWLDFDHIGTPAQWGATNSKPAWIAQCYVDYFARNRAYRAGQWRPKTLIGHGNYLAKYWENVRQWALSITAVSNYGEFQNIAAAEARAPFGFDFDHKAISDKTSTWAARPKTPWSVFELFYGSYQFDYGSTRLMKPLNAGALATGCSVSTSVGFGPTSPSWDLTGILAGKTLGELWYQTLNRPVYYNTIFVLYGDPTLVIAQ